LWALFEPAEFKEKLTTIRGGFVLQTSRGWEENSRAATMIAALGRLFKLAAQCLKFKTLREHEIGHFMLP
jgi:hypothetical protein